MAKKTKKTKTALLWPDEIRPPVNILIRAGVVERQGRQNRFIGSVEPGTRGAYVGPHPTMPEWHLVDVSAGYVPLHVSQFAKAEVSR